MSAPAALASQKPVLGRSWVKSAAQAVVASGRMPNTTPPCAAGTVIMANAARSGKAKTVQLAAANISPQSLRGGKKRRVSRRTASAAQPASVTRATVRNTGSKPVTASRVAGSVPANRHMPKKPSKSPSLSRERLIAATAPPRAQVLEEQVLEERAKLL